MSFFLIKATSDFEKQLHVLLSVDRDMQESFMAALIFTSRHSAEDYVALAGWTGDYSVEQIEPTELLKCLITAKKRGVTHVAIEPKREEQLRGERPELLPLNDPYCVHADVLNHLQREIAAPSL